MLIESLFPELSGQFGDSANVAYLRACVPDCGLAETVGRATPAFVRGGVDLLYLGSMPEDFQPEAMNRLRPHLELLRRRIDEGMAVLVTGNALELFGDYIQEGQKRLPGLGLFPFHAVRDMENRHNSMFLGRFGDIPMVGCKSQFSFCCGEFPGPFIQVQGGVGNSPGDKNEGFRYRNFFATSLLGPLLVLNPLFTKYLLRLLGQKDELPFEQEVMEAFRFRKEHLEEPGVNFIMGEHG